MDSSGFPVVAVAGVLGAIGANLWPRRSSAQPDLTSSQAHCEPCPIASCDSELRQLLQLQAELNQLRWLVVAAALLVVVLLLIVISQALCLIRCCSSRAVPGPAAGSRGNRAAGAIAPPARGSHDLLALLAAQEVRR